MPENLYTGYRTGYQRVIIMPGIREWGLDMRQNVIFLDVDGVLNCYDTKERIGCFIGIDDEKVAVLAEIVRITKADIVLSSSWKKTWFKEKKEGQDSLGNYLDAKLERAGLKIVDKTDDNGVNRGFGIRRWLDYHEHGRWIVIDDEVFPDFEECSITPRLVKTDFYGGRLKGGLRKSHIWKAVSLMKTEPVETPYGMGRGGRHQEWADSHRGREL